MRLNKKFEISIIGVGNIGFRYLQAVLGIESVVKINLFEKDTIFTSFFHLKMMKITAVSKIKHLAIYDFYFFFFNKF